jgi:hypothetical protein
MEYGPVSLFAMVALFRRHMVAVGMVVIVMAGLAYYVKHANPGYADGATVAFTTPTRQGWPFSGAQSLLVIDELTANSVMSTQGRREVRSAGGAADYDVALVNLYNEEYPNYSVPYVTVTTTSPDPVAAEDTFNIVMKVLQDDLVSLQARKGAPQNAWIRLRTIAAPTGPLPLRGSSKRTLAALAILALIASFVVAKFLDRHPVRITSQFRRRDQAREASLTRRSFRVRADSE